MRWTWLLGLAAFFVCGASAQKIAFVSSGDFSSNVYVMNADGSGRTRLTDGSGPAYEPRWSPDGTQILFGRRGGLLLMNADGSGMRLLNADLNDCKLARWSPDGMHILTLCGDDFTSSLFTMNADGTALRPYADIPFFVQVAVAEWSPDGRKVAYAADINAPDLSSLYILDVLSGFVEHKYSSAAAISGLQWSPDGSQIAFSNDFGLLLLDVDSSATPRVLDGAGFWGPVDWSPDGTRIVYVARGGAYSINVDGTGVIELAQAPTDFSYLRWTQDGTKIVGATWQNDFVDGGGKIYLINADGSGSKNLSANNAIIDSAPDVFGDFGDVTPHISEGGVVMANLLPAVHTISPLSIVSVCGTGFSAGSVYYPTLDDGGQIFSKLGGSCVEVNGERAPIFAMLPTQANIQAPRDLPLGPVSVTVIRNCDTADEIRSDAVMATVEQASPAFFLYPPYAPEGYIAARFNDGFAAVAPEGAIVDEQGVSRPARPGESISLFGAGWGPTKNQLATGEITNVGDSLPDGAGLMVTFDGVPLDPENGIEYAGIAPRSTGVYQLAIRVPLNAQPGSHQIGITVYGKSSPAGPVIPVAAP